MKSELAKIKDTTIWLALFHKRKRAHRYDHVIEEGCKGMNHHTPLAAGVESHCISVPSHQDKNTENGLLQTPNTNAEGA